MVANPLCRVEGTVTGVGAQVHLTGAVHTGHNLADSERLPIARSVTGPM